MTFSVIVPVYNEEKYIEKCIKSLMDQEEKPDEVIIIDNNCTDQSMSIAKKFNVQIVKETIQGMIPARNKGYNTATSDIIAKTDADTILPSFWVKKIKQDFKDNNIDALSGNFRTYDFPINVNFFSKMNASFLKMILGHYSLSGPNMAFTKAIWQKIKNDICLDSLKNHEDVDMAIHIHKAGGVIMYDPTLYVYSSSRRAVHNPFSFFIEYPLRTLQMKKNHQL